jgi:diguanylate cyclase (GGDEF)-like protein
MFRAVGRPSFIGGAALLAIAVSFSALCYRVVVDSRLDAEQEAALMATGASNVVEREIQRTIENYDLSLRRTTAALRSQNLPSLSESDRKLMLFDNSAAATMSSIFATDERGDVLYTSESSELKSYNFKDRSFFQIQRRDPNAGLIITEPMKSKMTGLWIISLSRRWNKPDGTFGGVVVGGLPVDYFAGALTNLELSPNSTINIFHQNGSILMRQPFRLQSIGAKTVWTERLPPDFTGRMSLSRKNSRDGIFRNYTISRVGNYPLYVNVGIATQDIYTIWQKRLMSLLWMIGIVLFASAILASLLIREFAKRRRREAEQEQLTKTLDRLAQTDALTQLANRRAFNEKLYSLVAEADRDHSSLICILMDIDHFKKLNDICGHLAGDAALVEIAAAIARNLSDPCDFAARYGGEEFAVLLPNTNGAGAYSVAERIRTSIKSLDIDNPLGIGGKLTVSMGFSLHQTGSPAETLVKQADKALYKAKSLGRDCVVAYRSGSVAIIDLDDVA